MQLFKKLFASSNTTAGASVKIWTASIINHLYWSVLKIQSENGDLVEATMAVYCRSCPKSTHNFHIDHFEQYSRRASIQNSGVKESELGEDLTNVVAGILANIKPGMLTKNSGGTVAQR